MRPMRFFAAWLVVSGVSVAQEQVDEDPSLPELVPAVTKLDFHDPVRLDGQVRKPDGALGVEVRPTGFAPMVALRTDFARELQASVVLAR